MSLARARCPACTLPLGDSPYTAIALRCMRCGTSNLVSIAADGQPVDFDAMFAAPRLLLWFGAARFAMAQGMPGVAIGACTHCAVPLTVSSREPLRLPCPHCQEPVSGPGGEVLVDLWPEAWAKVEGGGMDLEYRLAILEDSGGIAAGCAACAMPTPLEDPSPRCRRCNAVTWIVRPSGQRVQMGVRINGTRGDRPFKVVVPIAQGEAMLRSDAAIGTSDKSGKTVLGFTGVGCAVAVALFLVFWFGIFLAIYLSR